jgi:hypothetical protein
MTMAVEFPVCINTSYLHMPRVWESDEVGREEGSNSLAATLVCA